LCYNCHAVWGRFSCRFALTLGKTPFLSPFFAIYWNFITLFYAGVGEKLFFYVLISFIYSDLQTYEMARFQKIE